MSLNWIKSAASAALGGGAGAAPAEVQTPHKSLSKRIKIKELYVHPVKSCRGISVQSSDYDETGLRYDRVWLIVDAETRKFCTARDLPAMVTIVPEIDEAAGELRLSVPQRGDAPAQALRTPLNPDADFLSRCKLIDGIKIWADDDQQGYAVSDEADRVLSAFFGKPVHLVRKGPKPRASGPDIPEVLDAVKGAQRQWTEGTISFQDFYPVLVTTRASMRHLNRSILASVYPGMQPASDSEGEEEVKVTSHRVSDAVNREYWTPEHIETLEIRRFRPNIVLDAVDGDRLEGFEEDDWQHVEVFPAETTPEPPFGEEAEGKGRGILTWDRCLRCQVPSVDPDSGVRDPYLPNQVMQSYRRVHPDNKYKSAFGLLSTPRERGTLHVGDIVRVTRAAKRPVLDQTGSKGSGAAP